MKFKIVWIKPNIKVIYQKELLALEIRKTPDHKWLKRFPYLVNINGIDIVFQYDPVSDKLYADEENWKKNNQLIEKHAKLAERMEEEWKTEEEISSYFKWKGVKFIDRQEYVVYIWDANVTSYIKNYIPLI